MRTGDIKAVERTQALVQSGTVELLAAEEAKVVTRLVSAYLSGKLVDREAAIGIAVVAHLRSLVGKANRTIQTGIDAGRNLTR